MLHTVRASHRGVHALNASTMLASARSQMMHQGHEKLANPCWSVSRPRLLSTVQKANRGRILQWMTPSVMVATSSVAGIGTLWPRKQVVCEGVFGRQHPVDAAAQVIDEAARQNDLRDGEASKALFRKGEITFGTFLGFCTGYLVKKVGKLFLLAVGAGFVFLQYMSVQGFITINWDRIEGRYRNEFDVDKDGRVTRKDVQSRWQAMIGFLTHNLQFKSTFLIGFYTGIRFA